MTNELMTTLQQLRGKRTTMSELAKQLRENGEPRTFSARYLRNLNGYAKYREHTTIEIVKRLRTWYGLGCIFIDGNRQIPSCPNGYPLEPIYQDYRVILFVLKCG